MKKLYETSEKVTEKAIVFCPVERDEDRDYQFSEIGRLCFSAGLDVQKIFSQGMDAFNRRTIMGKGKLEEVRAFLAQNPADVLVVDFQLSGSQMRNLSEELKIKVLDRIMLIIDIFAQNARSNEGKVEVKLAQNRYLLTRLSGMQGSFGRFGGTGAGMRGPGETKLELDRRKLEKEILTLQAEIEKIKSTRTQNRLLRRKNGIKSVVLCGYTNAGKSSLFNLLTREQIYADDKLFATLDTTSRRMFLGNVGALAAKGDLKKSLGDLENIEGRKDELTNSSENESANFGKLARSKNGDCCVLTDTVGFISKLPHELVESFSATLEEVQAADLVLNVVDVSDPFYERNIELTDKILSDLNASKNRIVVLNKCDLLQKPVEIKPGQILFSVKNKTNLQRLKSLIATRLVE